MNYFVGDYTTGAIYTFSTTLPHISTAYTYYFEAYEKWGVAASSASPAIQPSTGPIVENLPPQLLYTGEENYLSDGLHPEIDIDFSDGIGPFVYRIKYIDPENDPPDKGYPKLVILKGTPPAPLYEVKMNEVDPADLTYTDGKLYSYTMPLSSPGKDYYYYFIAVDTFGATATTQILHGPIVTQNVPQLAWLGEEFEGYENDGLEPSSGTCTTAFVFKVKYINKDNDPPKTGYPKLVIKNAETNTEIPNSPFSMIAVSSGSYTTGVIYSCTTSLPKGSYLYYFIAYDTYNIEAVGPPTSSTQPLSFVVSNELSSLIYTNEKGYESDAVEPDSGEVNTTQFVFRIIYTDKDNEPPLNGYPKLHLLLNDNKFATYTMEKESGSPETGEVYKYSLKISTPGVYKYYFECYEINGTTSAAPAGNLSFTVYEKKYITVVSPIAGVYEISAKELQNFTLTWSSLGKIKPEDVMTYTVYLSSTETSIITSPENKIYVGRESSVKVANLEYGKRYWWKVVASDEFGNIYESALFSFMLSPPVQKAYNFPNPFIAGTKTNIVFNMRSEGNVKLQIFSPFHRLLHEETYINLPQGVNILFWDGNINKDGNYQYQVQSGLYLCRILKEYHTGEKESEIVKIVLIR
jgi:hypothetical protein